ncbi:MAG: restriction endonuclease [Clostridia bacterium]|nr:restriction endonuclease [Clostridia bacterium]
MKVLTIESLIKEAEKFCKEESRQNHPALVGITDGKAIGTYVEHRFQERIRSKYIVNIGNSAKGVDFPDSKIMTDIKVTSASSPQSSCPFTNAKQKIYGLGYNLLMFIYEKHDSNGQCSLKFTHCSFISAARTGDYTVTKRLREMLSDGANKDDIIGYLSDRGLPGDETLYSNLADEIMHRCPEQGYLTISNAMQWRLQYSHVLCLDEEVDGIINYEY